jgi:hypothetical protein
LRPKCTVADDEGLLAIGKFASVQDERAVAGWRKAGRTLGMSNRELADFADAFEHPERAAAQKRLG